MNLKIRILSIVFVIMFFGLIARLFYWQVVKGADLSQQAKSQYNSSEVNSAPRGNIFANDLSFFVLRTDVWTVFANTKNLEESPRVVSQKLAPFFVKDSNNKEELLVESQRLETLLSKKTTYVSLKSRVATEVKRNIEALKIEGLGFDVTDSRFYPEASSAAQLLGFVGKDDLGDNVGYFGLEGYYNLSLSGKSGFTKRQKDAKGSPILIGKTTNVSAISGVDLVTHLDKRIQMIIEEQLKDSVEKYGAIGGSVTVLDPKTGGILAMASYPSFDPRSYWEYSDGLFRNPVVSDSFEPGSILKVVVMAAGLDAGVIEPDTECDICGEPLKLDKYLIKTWNNQYTKNISMADVIIHSDNVGMSFVGNKLGEERLYDYLDKFGIGRLTDVDLQGEVAPPMRKRGTWSNVDLATTSFGQGIVVTGIQMVRAVSAIANGGYLITPKVVKTIKSEGWEEDVVSESPKRIINDQAAKEITQMMVQAVNQGEAKWTKVPGFSIAGKTGTAQIPVEGHYDAVNTNHSFIGFAPAENAKFVMLVTLKSPQTSPWAAETAAPTWFSIAKELFPYLGVAPSE